jgi:hypothetical protein
MGIGIRGTKEVAGIIYKIRDLKQIPILEKEIGRWGKKIITPHT